MQQDVPHQAITASTFITLRFNLTDKREKVGRLTFVLNYNIYTEVARRPFTVLTKCVLAQKQQILNPFSLEDL